MQNTYLSCKILPFYYFFLLYYDISFYTLNPAWYITPEKIQEIQQTGAEIIPVNITYSTSDEEAKRYPGTILAGHKYIMVDYVENFIDFCEKYKIPIYGKE